MTSYRYLTVSQWGGTWNGIPATEKMPDGETYIHHVGGQAWMGEDAISVFRQLNDYAKNVKGYQFLDYDILVHYSRQLDLVTIAEGRGQYRSAATLDRNEEGEAICLCANTDLREPHPAEIEGIALATVWGVEKGWIARDSMILGHRDNPAHPGATACPGRFLYAQLPAIRSRVAGLLNPVKVTMWNQPLNITAGVKSAPPTADVLAGRYDTWAGIALVKALQAFTGLPVNGQWDQRFGETINAELAKRGITL